MVVGQPSVSWQLPPQTALPTSFIKGVERYLPQGSRCFAPIIAQLLWRRGIRDPEQIAPFLDPSAYTSTSLLALGNDVERACDRLIVACDRQESVAIWGDFDADGLTATAVIWEGLSTLFPDDRLTYQIPNRLTQSHGLNREGIDALAQQGCKLIVTCDTGSTHATEIQYARDRGIDTIVTDHHTLPEADAPFPALALINPRRLPPDHPLAHLSGVAVAYKLIEALYERLELPPPEFLLDLVAIGLIADLVELRGDCRYLAQQGIKHLQQRSRPGLKHLIQQCQRSGDRPADISYGIGPRINAVSRIYGDASFCVELLTTRDDKRAAYLAQQAELANQRRRSLQQRILQDAESQLQSLERTTRVIVLSDPQWSIGILGLVAAQVAQRYGRPTLLLQTPAPDEPALARGSARSVQGIDLYALIDQHSHLLHQFGGHPYALGLSLPVENIALLKTALNRQTRAAGIGPASPLEADLALTVEEVGPSLFQAFKPLEPFGVGHPIPKILLQGVWFTDSWSPRQTDLRGQRTHYPRTTFKLCDASCPEGRPGIWWGHRKEELPSGRCDVLVELDFDSTQKDYRIRLVALAEDEASEVRPDADIPNAEIPAVEKLGAEKPGVEASLLKAPCPPSPCSPSPLTPEAIWQGLVGIAKYLSRTRTTVTAPALADRLGIGEAALTSGLAALAQVGFEVASTGEGETLTLQISRTYEKAPPHMQQAALRTFLWIAHEEQFRCRYGQPQPL
ncbi:MAG: single-stranded-DNA-specific exonuclease RecJ [Elainellaceae cyanobacterium]